MARVCVPCHLKTASDDVRRNTVSKVFPMLARGPFLVSQKSVELKSKFGCDRDRPTREHNCCFANIEGGGVCFRQLRDTVEGMTSDGRWHENKQTQRRLLLGRGCSSRPTWH